MLIVILPVITVSLGLYLLLTFLGNQVIIWILALILGLLVSFALIKPDLKENKKSLIDLFQFRNWLLILVILIVLAAKAFVLSPVILTKTVDNFTHIQITDVGDYYKHTFVTSSLIQDGIPPKNPYFPEAKLSYYFGYYLIPATISKVFGAFPNWSFYIFSLLADFVSFLLILEIINKTIKKYYLKLLAVLLTVFGAGVDVIPFVFNTLGQAQNDLGLQLINNYKALLFVPQHFLAAALTAWVIYKLLYDKLKLIHLALISSFIFLCSIFVSITFLFWLLLIFVFNPKLGNYLFKAGILAILILLPYLISFSDRNNLFYLNHFIPYSFTNNFLINTLLTFFVKYGPMLILLPLAAYFAKSFNKVISLGIFLILAVTWFIRSPIFNDFSMRTSMPIQLVIPTIAVVLLQKTKSKIIYLLLVTCYLFTLLISIKGFYLEYSNHWKNRQFLAPKDSEILLNLRSLPANISLAALERDRWVELTPSLAFKKIQDPYLYDSYVYFADKKLGQSHGEYENQANNLFLQARVASNLDQLISQQNNYFQSLNQFFSRYPAQKLILSNQLWIKKDTNPWVIILNQLGVASGPITPHFSLFDYPQLLEKTKTAKIVINQTKGSRVAVLDRRVQIPAGLSYLAFCADQIPEYAKLEFEDYYLLFDQNLTAPNSCLGKIFWINQSENVLLTKESTVKELDIYPIEVSR